MSAAWDRATPIHGVAVVAAAPDPAPARPLPAGPWHLICDHPGRCGLAFGGRLVE
jgi:hypothetical protein